MTEKLEVVWADDNYGEWSQTLKMEPFGYYVAIYKICIVLNCIVNDVMEFIDNK